MTGDTSITIAFATNIVLFLFSCYNFYKARQDDTKTDTRDQIESNIKLDQVCNIVNETRNDVKGLLTNITELKMELFEHKTQITSIWKAIDAQTKRIEHLEHPDDDREE